MRTYEQLRTEADNVKRQAQHAVARGDRHAAGDYMLIETTLRWALAETEKPPRPVEPVKRDPDRIPPETKVPELETKEGKP